MIQYTSRPRGLVVSDDADDAWLATTTMEAITEDDAPQETGLVDEDGRKLYRVSPKIPLGFCR